MCVGHVVLCVCLDRANDPYTSLDLDLIVMNVKYGYRYTGEGMEELEFTEAESNIADLIVRIYGLCIWCMCM